MMTSSIFAHIDARVQAIVAVRRVLVAVHPRLLADVLVRALASPDVEVVLEGERGSTTGAFDIAVVDDVLPPGVTAEVVVRLPDSAGVAPGSITTVAGTEPAVLGDLPSLLEALHRFLGSS